MTEIEELVKVAPNIQKDLKKRKLQEKSPLTNRTWQEVLDGKIVNSSQLSYKG